MNLLKKEIEKMFTSLNSKTADRIMDCLTGGGDEVRAAKAVRVYRKDPANEDAEQEALAALSQLDQNKQTEIRQAARL